MTSVIPFLALVVMLVLGPDGGARSLAAGGDGLTPVVPSLNASARPEPGAKPPPKLVRVAPPRAVPPMSPPLEGTSLVRDEASGAPIAVPAAKVPDAPTVSGTDASAAASGQRLVRYTATEVNIRPKPEQDARRIDILDEGTAVEVVGPVTNGQWVKVARHGRVLGYVSAEFLLTRPPPPH